ncbi:MAG: hypothetical protein ACE5OY_01475 [Candidatus Bathyarchaeia archaeon]
MRKPSRRLGGRLRRKQSRRIRLPKIGGTLLMWHAYFSVLTAIAISLLARKVSLLLAFSLPIPFVYIGYFIHEGVHVIQIRRRNCDWWLDVVGGFIPEVCIRYRYTGGKWNPSETLATIADLAVSLPLTLLIFFILS